MMTTKDLLEQLKREHEVGKKEELNYTKTLTTGIVVDTDDPLEMGRLRIFCPTLNDNPKKIHHLPWAIYVPPFGGVVANSQYARGTGKYPENTEGAVAYGLWSIPEQGAKVIVACIDGDERRRIWLGCMHEHQEAHTILTGRYKWEDGSEVDGPLSSSGEPIEPLYTNSGKAFKDDRKSREWKTRQAEYQVSAIDPNEDDPNSSKTGYTDQFYPEISEAEEDDWVKPILGSHGYDWSGNKAVGEHKASRVIGLSSPGGHVIMMDDRAFNSRMKIKTATGHQILLDDTNERIYISTNEGANWIEMDSSGNIDIFSERRVSVHAEKDINFSTDESFRVKAKKGIYMYAGDTEGQDSLDDEKPEDGEIRFHSTGDTHVMTEGNLRTLVQEDHLNEIGGTSYNTIANDIHLQVQNDFNIISNNGDYNISINGNYNHNVSGNTFIFSGGTNRIHSIQNTQLFSLTGSMSVRSDSNMTVRSNLASVSVRGLIQSAMFSTTPPNPGSFSISPGSGSSAGPPETNNWSINLSVAQNFVNFAPAFKGSQPKEAAKSELSLAEISPWTNRVPQHEPWPRVMKQDNGDEVNEENEGYKNNVDWIDQYDNESSPEGLQPIGRIEGDEEIERGPLWRR